MTSAYPPEEFVGLTTIASSPCENNNLIPQAVAFQSSSTSTQQHQQKQQQQQQQQQQWSVMITPTSSPTKEMESLEGGVKKTEDDINDNVCSLSYCSDDDQHDDEEEYDEDESDADTMIERERFVLDPCNELDLDQIEKY